MDKYEQIKQIGRGAQGVVYLVKDHAKHKKYVVKEIPMSVLPDKEREQARQEADMLRELNHPNIVEYVESFLEKDNMYMVMGFCSAGDLTSHIRVQAKKEELFEERQVLDWFVQICNAVHFIHSKRVLHRDLKSNNVFLTDRNVIKLGDFGIARLLEHTLERAETVVGTPFYMSPEVCENKPYDYKSDVWALGCILYEMCTLQHAFKANNLLGIVFKIMQGEYAPISTEKYSPELQELVDWLLNKDDQLRPTMTDILNNEFVQEHVEEFMKTGGGTMGQEIPALVRKAKQMQRQPTDKAMSHAERIRRMKAKRREEEEKKYMQQLEQARAETAQQTKRAQEFQYSQFHTTSRPGGDVDGDATITRGLAPMAAAKALTEDEEVDFEATQVKFQPRVRGPPSQAKTVDLGDAGERDLDIAAGRKTVGSKGGGWAPDEDDKLEQSLDSDSKLVGDERPLPVHAKRDDRPITATGKYDVNKYMEDNDMYGDGLSDYESDYYSEDFDSDAERGDENADTIRPMTAMPTDDNEQKKNDEDHERDMAEVLSHMRRMATGSIVVGSSSPPHQAEAKSALSGEDTYLYREGSAKDDIAAGAERLAALARQGSTTLARNQDLRRRNVENTRQKLVENLGKTRFDSIYDFIKVAHTEGKSLTKDELLLLVKGNRQLLRSVDEIQNLICMEEFYGGGL